MDKLLPVTILFAALFALLLVTLIGVMPYAKRGYDQTVIEKYAANYTANMGDLK